MSQAAQQLVRDIIALTGADGPALLEADSPALAADALLEDETHPMYIVGLIGGKDVGKSALVNALVGRRISISSGFGEGTQKVIAYVHETQEAALRELLDREAPNQYEIVPHSAPRLSRQVLLDLPDIDSHYAAHVELARRMLRHMLYPVWVQSVEKYADQAPQKLLQRVADGNDPRNFVFCLNKADQVVGRLGDAAARELRDDYAARLARVLKLPDAPKVWMISATDPEHFELPALRSVLQQQRTGESVSRSRRLAQRQQENSLLAWVDGQSLEGQLDSARRLESQASDDVARRIGGPLLDEAIPHILDDPAMRAGLGDALMRKRIAHWPVVNVVAVLISPIASLLRRRLSLEAQRGLEGPEELVDLHLRDLGVERRAALAGAQEIRRPGVADALQSAFAGLQQSNPLVSRLYRNARFWEAAPAQGAEIDLRRRLAATLERQREVAAQRIARRGSVLAGFWRVLLTFGAILWFPIVQPLLAALVGGKGGLPALAIELLGATYLLKNLGFLLLYFAGLWLVIKWDTQRRVDRMLDHWKRGARLDPTLSLPGQAIEWMQQLHEPIRAHTDRMAALVAGAASLRESIQGEAA